MLFETRGGNVLITISADEQEALQGQESLRLPAEFHGVLAKAISDRAAKKAEDLRREDLARQAAEACPIKVGQEVRDPKAWRNASAWWRVERVGGTPSSPTLYTRAVRADGSAGQRTETFGFGLERLEVRESTEGAPAEQALPGLKLAEIADRIHAHLQRIEREQAKDSEHKFYNSAAFVAGPKVRVRYVSYQGATTLTRAQAAAYLEKLDSGHRGSHYGLV